MMPYQTSTRSCRPGSTGASERIISWESARILKTSVLLVLCCLMAGSNSFPIASSKNIERRSSSFSNKDRCQHHSSTSYISCSFHDTCIESTFQCGSQGLALSYSLPRCEELRLLQHSESGCPRCIQNQAIIDWVLASEKCFQPRLLHLVQNQTTSKQYPDPPDCLNFEADALDILEQCYSEGMDSVCQLMDNVSFEDLQLDLKVAMDAVTVSSYYKNIVMKQFRDLINSCNHPQASNLATKVTPKTESMLLCVSYLVNNELSEAGLATALAEKLNQSPTDFKLASYDTTLVDACQKKSDPDWRVGTADYYLVQWTLSTGADQTALTQCLEPLACADGLGRLVYFAYTSLTTSSCGNGLREAGESCDLFVYTGQEEYGCSEQCHTIPGYECTTQRLQQSFCSKTVCGDGHRTADEECDEGDTFSNGCIPGSCTIQEGYKCANPYNGTSHCTELPSLLTLSTASSTQAESSLLTPSPVPLPSESPSGAQPLVVDPTNVGLASGAHPIQRTLHLWSVVLTLLLASLLFQLIWR